MRIVEFIHDNDHPKFTNLDYWLRENSSYQTKKIIINNYVEFPQVKDIDLIILHGGLQHLWNKDADPWLYREIEYVREALKNNKPVIGFCLGSQIIAEALKGKVYKANEKEVGWFKVIIPPEVREHLLLEGLEEGFTSFMWHSDHYELPGNCTSLGFTEAAKHQIFVSDCFPAIGFQFHPEYTIENIRTYLEIYDDEAWSDGRYALGKSNFIKEIELIPKTYDLFKQLIANSLKWLSIKK